VRLRRQAFATDLLPYRTDDLLPYCTPISAAPSAVRETTFPGDDGNIPRLLAHLNANGLHLRAIPTQKNGSTLHSGYLTTTDQSWSYFNGLLRDPKQIHHWQGTIYCGLKGQPENADLEFLWGDCYFTAGAFFFFGDRSLLKQIQAALQTTAD
jgi:hypothetical protein